MKQSKSVFTALVLTGILGFCASPAQSQSKPGDSSGSDVSKGGRQEQGSPSGKSGRMKSGDTGSAADSSSQKSAKQGQWGKDDIKKVQEALKEKGNDPGPIDGVMGRQTTKAIREFQQSNGLKTTGRLNNETAKALGVENGSSSSDTGASSMEKGSSSKGSSSSKRSSSGSAAESGMGQKSDSQNK